MQTKSISFSFREVKLNPNPANELDVRLQMTAEHVVSVCSEAARASERAADAFDRAMRFGFQSC